MNPAADAALALGPWTSTGVAQATASACFPAALPVFLGHFPGHPLVPGVHQLALVAELTRRALGHPDLVVLAVERSKWTLPLKPDETLEISATWIPHDEGAWRVDGRVLRAGIIACVCRLLLAPL